MGRFDTLAGRVLQAYKNYNGKEPLYLWLKEYYRQNKQMGSTDRKLFSALFFGLFRFKGARPVRPDEDMINMAACLQWPLPAAYGNYLTEKDERYRKVMDLAEAHQWAEAAQLAGWEEEGYFPMAGSVSDAIDRIQLELAHLHPSHVWIRVRSGFEKEVGEELRAAGYEWEEIQPRCWRMKGHYPLHTSKTWEAGKFELQDIASQETATGMHPESGQAWFDCCAGAGGKSLMLLDKCADISLTVNDTRPDMLDELQRRLVKAGLPLPKTMQADLSLGIYEGLGPFDGIIADLPCTGSGTWGRAPERLHFFREEEIAKYAALQLDIVSQAYKVLKPDGRLFYITCSVFRQENEENIERITSTLPLKCVNQTYHFHHPDGGDTLFVAGLEKV